MIDDAVPLAGSHRDALLGMKSLGRVSGEEPITVSLYLKPASAAGVNGEVGSRAGLADARTTDHADDLAAITAFAQTYGLTVEDSDAGRRPPADPAGRGNIRDGEGVRHRASPL